MPTTSQGIYFPDANTNVTPLHTVFSTMASSIDNILAGDVQIHKVANTTQRNALVSQYGANPANPLFVWRADAPNGRELEYTKNGTTWYYVPTTADVSSWNNISIGGGLTGTAQYRVVSGTTVHVRWHTSNTMNPGQLYDPMFTVPSGFRPASGFAQGVAAAAYGASAHPVSARILPNGQCQIRNNHSASISGQQGYAIYTTD